MKNESQSPSLRGSGRFGPDHGPGGDPSPPSQSPSLRGSGRFLPAVWRGERGLRGSQSPSLRGSGRFVWRADPERLLVILSLNPLHCGAVVASEALVQRLRNILKVSIPFIAGQWSLPRRPQHQETRTPSLSQSPSLRGSGRFVEGPPGTPPDPVGLNPLHCGAVVASAGPAAPEPNRGPRLNPLHCGAVVASRRKRGPRRKPGRGSQSPSLRGSGRFLKKLTKAETDAEASQSPSLRGSGRFGARRSAHDRRRQVSIPFIAGQWSLRAARLGADLAESRVSQSPSLRGSGRFPTRRSAASFRGSWSQSPSLRGSGRFTARSADRSGR